MASVEIREGFLCPICLQDLGSVIQLQDHFELAHAGEDNAVLNQLKGAFICYLCQEGLCVLVDIFWLFIHLFDF